jgi:dynein heavy chain
LPFCFQELCRQGAELLQTKSALVEEAVNELIAMLLRVDGEEEQEELEPERDESPDPEFARKASTKSKKSTGNESEVLRPVSAKTGASSRLGSAAISPNAAALKRKREMKDYLIEEAQELLSYFNHRNVDAIVRVTKATLDAMRKRVTVSSTLHYIEAMLSARDQQSFNTPLFKSFMTLAIPNVTMQPALDEIQQTLNRAAQKVVNVARSIKQWERTCKVFMKPKVPEEEFESRSRSVSNATSIDEDGREHLSTRRTARSETDSSVVSGLTAFIKKDNYFKQVSENKEIAKLLSILSTLINSTKKEVTTALEHFDIYDGVWKLNRDEELEKFLQGDVSLSEFEAMIYHYEALEKKIMAEPESYSVGAVALYTGRKFVSSFCFLPYTQI